MIAPSSWQVIENKTIYICTKQKMGIDKKMDDSILSLSGSALTAEVIKWETHPFRIATHNAMAYKHGHCGWDDATTKTK